MADNTHNSVKLEDHDIVFDCEHCGNSLAIDIKGAGLKMQCPECKRHITVPIPDGLDLADIDSSLAESPNASVGDALADEPGYDGGDDRMNALLTELEELRFRTQFLEKKRIEYQAAVRDLANQLDSMRIAMKEMDDTLGGLVEKSSDDTQELG